MNFRLGLFLTVFSMLFFAGFANASTNLIGQNIDFNDSVVLLGDSVDMNFAYSNDGIDDTNTDYFVLFYINDNLDLNQTRSDILGASDSNTQNYVWDANELGDTNVFACVDYIYEEDNSDNCTEEHFTVYFGDINAGSIIVSDNSVNFGDANLDINVQIGNSGIVDANVDAVLYVMQGTNHDNNFVVSWNDFNVPAGSFATQSFTWSDVNLPGDLDFNLIVSSSETDSNAQNDFNYSSELMHVSSADLNVGDIDFNDANANISYGDSLLITATFGNSGDATATQDYNLLYKINSTTVANYLFSTDLNSGQTDTNAYTWTSNIAGDVNIQVCIDNSVSGGDSSENDCNSKIVHVKAVDLNAVSITFSDADANVSSGTSVTATLTYKNIGDLSADNNYTVIFYKKTTGSYSTITSCSFTRSDNLIINDTNTQTCTFSLTSTSNVTYTIKGELAYTGDKSTSNDSATKTLYIVGSGSGSGDSGGGGGGSDSSDEDVDSDIDLKGISLTYPSESSINKEVSFDFVFKNVGVAKATDSYTASVTISKKGDEVKKCSQTFTDDLDIDASKTFNCKWTPNTAGFFSLVANIDYSSADDDSSNDKVEDKIIKIIDPSATTTSATSTTDANDKGVVVLGENKLQQTISNSSVLFNDLNSIFSAWGKEPPKDLNENLYSNITITRDFNNIVDANDVNKKSTVVTIKLFNSGDANIVDSIYYEIIPDFFGDKNVLLKFDINALDINKEFVLSYSLQTSVDANQQKDFFGFMLKKDVLEDFSLKDIAKKPFWENIWKEVWFIIVLIVIGVIIVIALVIKIIKMSKGNSSSLARWGE